MTIRAPQQQDKFIIRLPDGMREQISEAAKANGRTMNAEVVARLKLTFELDKKGGDVLVPETRKSGDLEARIAALEARLDGLVPDFTLLERVQELETWVGERRRTK